MRYDAPDTPRASSDSVPENGARHRQAAPLVVSAGAICLDGRLLTCQRCAQGPHPGMWELPGGKRETGESLETCLRRELREELGLDTSIGRELWRTCHTYPKGPTVDLHVFHVAVCRGQPINRVFSTIAWMAPEELETLDLLAADRVLVDLIIRGVILVPPTRVEGPVL